MGLELKKQDNFIDLGTLKDFHCKPYTVIQQNKSRLDFTFMFS